ncbi:MAG: bacteriohemerythrin, partial [Desulfobulbia bacterium]
IAGVDSEHRELVELINELHNQLDSKASKQSISEFLGEVFAKISSHFALEESVMRKHSYDQYSDHKNDHEKLLDDIRQIMDDFEDDKYIDYVESLTVAVHDWFVNHFKTKDARLHNLLGV